MNIRECTIDDKVKVMQLFSEVFNQHMLPETWEWKYIKHGYGIFAVVAEEKGHIVGHYGSMPRRIRFKGVDELSAVVSDVMVHPIMRGAFTKRGLFYRLVNYYAQKYCPQSEERKIKIPYGFPTERAKNIGIRLGLYQEVEEAVDFLFVSKQKFFDIPYSIKPCGLSKSVVENLWQTMKSENENIIVNYRDYATLSWRYSQPNATFSFFCVYRFMRPVSILVVREDSNPKKVYDYVGSLKYLGRSLNLLSKLYKNVLKVRLPPWLIGKIKEVSILEYTDKVALVANALTGPYAEELRGQFFYTYGDEDV